MLRTGSTVSSGGVEAFQGVQGESPVLCKIPGQQSKRHCQVHPVFGEVTIQQESDLRQRAPCLPSVLLVLRGRGDFLSKSHLYCTKQPGLGWPSSFKQRPHLAHAQAGDVEISVFPRVGWKGPAFDKVVKCVYKRDKEEAGSHGPLWPSLLP